MTRSNALADRGRRPQVLLQRRSSSHRPSRAPSRSPTAAPCPPRSSPAPFAAGTIASSNGSAMVTPMPRSTVRRESCFFSRYISVSLLRESVLQPASCSTAVIGGRCLDRRSRHPERRAVDDAEMNDDISIAVLRRVADDGADGGHVVVLDLAAERVGHQALGKAQENRVRVLQQRLAQIRGPSIGVPSYMTPFGSTGDAAVLDRATCLTDRSSRAPGRADRSPGGTSCTTGWRDAAPSARAPTARAPPSRALVSSRSGTLGGGGGGGVPSSTSITHLPRSTGEVRSAIEVSCSTLPWPRMPRRAGSASGHAGTASPITFGMP